MEQQGTPIIDREIFFGNPEIIGGQLSPDGKHLAFIKPHQGVRNIWVKAIGQPFESATLVTADKTRPIPGYFWSRDSKHILYVQDKGGNEDFHVFAVNPFIESDEVPEARNLSPLEGVKAVIYRVPKTDPNFIYVGLNDRDKAWHDLYKINLATGERILHYENNHQINGWIFDLEDQLRLVSRSTEEGGTEILRIEGDQLQQFYQCSVEEDCHVIRYHKDGKHVYLETNKGAETNLSKLILLNPITGEQADVESDPEQQVDFGSALFSEVTNELLATIYQGDKPRYYFKDSELAADYQLLKAQFPGAEIKLASSTKDEQLWLINANSDVDPGATYLFDRKTKETSFQYRPRPNLPTQHLSKMQAIRYLSEDDLEIPAYLTVPQTTNKEPMPAILLIHGGPWARDYWGYDSYAQFLANRGYLVLQPNFRGSTGYGKAFLNAGNGEWGEKMQADISAGVKFLIKNGLADPKRIGIMGGSYGGYATLAGLTFTPGLYALGVSIVGPSNLLTLLGSIPPYWETIRNMFYKRIANPETEEGKAQLKRQSPLFHAKKITAPLMVVQGANDPRVKKAESDQVVIALRELGLPVEYLLAENEGHGFADPINNMAFIAAMEQFLSQHLGGRYQKEIPDSIAQRLKELKVDISKLELDSTETVQTPHFPQIEQDLSPFVLQYQMSIYSGKDMVPIDFERSVIEKNDQWVVTDKAHSLMGGIEDVAVLEKGTLRPVHQKMIQGPATIQIDYKPQIIQGTTTINNKNRPFQLSCEQPCVGAGVARTVLIQQLPLKEGYELTYQVFNSQFQKIFTYHLSVLGIEKLKIEAGEFDTFKVENKAMDGSGEVSTLWINCDFPRFLVKSDANIPMMGAKFVFELKAKESV